MDFFDQLMNASPVVMGRLAPPRRGLDHVLGNRNREVCPHFRVFAPCLAVIARGAGQAAL